MRRPSEPSIFTTIEARMTRIASEIAGMIRQTIGQMIGDDKLVLEGKEEQRQAERKEPSGTRRGNEGTRGRE